MRIKIPTQELRVIRSRAVCTAISTGGGCGPKGVGGLKVTGK